MYVGLMDLKTSDLFQRYKLRQVLMLYHMSGKPLNDIKSMYINIMACERESFRNVGEYESFSCPLAFQYMHSLSNERSVKGVGRVRVRLSKEERE